MDTSDNNEDTEVMLDAETLAALDEGIELAENGQRWSVEEAFAFARRRRAAWKSVPTDRTA